MYHDLLKNHALSLDGIFFSYALLLRVYYLKDSLTLNSAVKVSERFEDCVVEELNISSHGLLHG